MLHSVCTTQHRRINTFAEARKSARAHNDWSELGAGEFDFCWNLYCHQKLKTKKNSVTKLGKHETPNTIKIINFMLKTLARSCSWNNAPVCSELVQHLQLYELVKQCNSREKLCSFTLTPIHQQITLWIHMYFGCGNEDRIELLVIRSEAQQRNVQ